jgi:monomeric sarcosine oxidase
MGSSHGDTRITRQAYYEDPIYVPIAAASQQMIKDLEKEQGVKLYD